MPRDQYQRFYEGLKDEKLPDAFIMIENELYDADGEFERVV